MILGHNLFTHIGDEDFYAVNNYNEKYYNRDILLYWYRHPMSLMSTSETPFCLQELKEVQMRIKKQYSFSGTFLSDTSGLRRIDWADYINVPFANQECKIYKIKMKELVSGTYCEKMSEDEKKKFKLIKTV